MTLQHRLLTVTSMLVVTAAVAAGQGGFRTRTDAVIVDVAVTDRGRPVAGLTREDFEVRDNGVLQTVLHADLESMLVDADIIVDRSESVRSNTRQGLEAAASEIQRLLPPPHAVQLWWVGPSIVRAADEGHQTPTGPTRAAYGDHESSIHDAVLAALVRPARTGYRKVIVVLTDGQDTSSFSLPGTIQGVVDRAGATVHVLAAGGQARTGLLFHHGQELGARTAPVATPVGVGTVDYGLMMRQLYTTRTGGVYADLADGLALSALIATLEDSRLRYVVRFMPAGVARGGWHRLTVKIKNRNYRVRARAGYDDR